MKKINLSKTIKSLFTSTIILSSVAAPITAFAQDYDTLINNTQIAIDGLSAQQAILYAELAAGYEALDALRAQAEELLETIKEDDKSIDELNSQIEELEALIDKRNDLLKDQARAVQENGGTTNYLNLVASADSISDFVGRLDVVRRMVASNKDLLTTQKEDKEAVIEKKAEVEEAKEAKVQNQVALEELKAGLEAQQMHNEDVLAQLTSDLTLAQQHRDALIAEKAAYEEQQRILAEQAAAAEAAAIAAAEIEQAQLEAQQLQAEAEAAQLEAQAQAEAAEAAAVVAQEAAEAAAVIEIVEAPEVASEEVATETPVLEEVANEEVVTQDAQAQAEAAAQAQAEALAAQEAAQRAAQEAAAQAEVQKAAAEDAAVKAAAATEAAAVATGNVSALLNNAAQYLGTPYVWGGKNPSGFDCSGFVQYIFQQTYGINVGGWTVAQESAGTHISVAEAKAGDLYFWGTPGETYHVAIATGNGGYIHASQPGTPLEYNSINNFTPQFAVRVNVN